VRHSNRTCAHAYHHGLGLAGSSEPFATDTAGRAIRLDRLVNGLTLTEWLPNLGPGDATLERATIPKIISPIRQICTISMATYSRPLLS
jgi:hypothetical protein